MMNHEKALLNKPNIIFLMTDTTLRQALSCYGSPFIRTPNIDSLCSRSCQFKNCYQPATLCMPSRSTWWTGLYQSTHKVYSNDDKFNREIPTLFKYLSKQNYYGGYLGLFHCWPGEKHDGLDDWSWLDFVLDHIGETYDIRLQGLREYAKKNDFTITEEDLHDFTEENLRDFRNHAGYTDFPIERHITHRLTDKAIECIDDFQDDRPNALWVSYWMPHEPWAPPVPYNTLYSPEEVILPENIWDQRKSRPEHHNHPHVTQYADLENEGQLRRLWAAYAGMVSYVDDQIGRILSHLKEKNLYEDSMIVFSTDHGTTLGVHGWMYKGRSYMIEEISHIPCIVKLPNQSQPHQVNDIVSTADFTPTILDMLKLPHEHLHGRSWFQDVFKGKERENPYALGIHGKGDDHEALSVRMLRKEVWKYNVYSKEGVEELYNIKEDPYEMKNLAKENPELCGVLNEELKSLLHEQNDDFIFR